MKLKSKTVSVLRWLLERTPAGRALLFVEWDRGFEAGRQIERICAEINAAEYLEAHEVRRD